MQRAGVKGLRKPPLAARLMGYAFFALSLKSVAVYTPYMVRVRKCAFETR